MSKELLDIHFLHLQCQNERRAEQVIIAICLFNAGSLGETVLLSVLQQVFF